MATDAERPPLFFVKSLGSLRPANKYAEAALKAIDGTVRVRITKMNRNQRRRALYWVILDCAAEALHDRHDITMDAELLHDLLKQKLGLGEWIVLPSGDRIFKPQSTSDRAMDEVARTAWLERASACLAHWIGVPMATLLDEARGRHGGDD